jgi:uncharacterized protein (TIGR04255 family)
MEVISRIGVRYISEYPNFNLTSCINFDFSFGRPDIRSDNYSFRTEFKDKDRRYILNLVNSLPVIQGTASTKFLSAIDIDVIKENISIDVSKGIEIIDVINELHQSEKELFFSLLKDDFLKTLNPVY